MPQGALEAMQAPVKAPVLLTAATRWEAAPLARALGLASIGDGRFEGRLGGRSIVLIKTGIGAIAARQALEGGPVAADFGLALGVGLCGALQEDLRTGDLVVDPREADLDFVVPLRDTAKTLGATIYFGKILHTDVILQPAMKRKLGAEQRAAACDMETSALRRWAHGSPLPVIALRAVLDELDESLPAEAPGGEHAAALTRYAVSHAASLPALIRVGLRSRRAMKTLSRFLKAYLEAL
ncbi:MAG: hypothetical protein HY552_03610 [Elusimicrobia bacterium]|nr:hypothetical protein [Elusimicrobiota bacterium]